MSMRAATATHFDKMTPQAVKSELDRLDYIDDEERLELNRYAEGVDDPTSREAIQLLTYHLYNKSLD